MHVSTYTDPGENAFLLESASDQCLQVHHFPRVVVHFSSSFNQLPHPTLAFLPFFFFSLFLCCASAIANIHDFVDHVSVDYLWALSLLYYYGPVSGPGPLLYWA